MAKRLGKGTFLIVADGKPGHVNQSLAFASLLGSPHELLTVSFKNRAGKFISYLLDRVGIYWPGLLSLPAVGRADYSAVVATGSETYYAAKLLAKSLKLPVVAIMFPRGYRLDFDLIIAQEHDRPPKRSNILPLPVNLSCPVPRGLVKRGSASVCVAVVIGGPSRHFRMDAQRLQATLSRVLGLFPDAEFLVTTSRRTPPEVEEFIATGPYRYTVIYSREPVNPIPDFLALSDYVFVTEDSTSMISEAVSFGSAAVEVVPLTPAGTRNKVGTMVENLAAAGYLHVFDGTVGGCRRKLDLASLLEKRFEV